MASASKSITLEEEIGAFMIATVAILLIWLKKYEKNKEFYQLKSNLIRQQPFNEKPMSCIEIAGLANSHRWPNELRIHGEEMFSDNVGELRRAVHKPSILGFQWESIRVRNNPEPGFGDRIGFSRSSIVAIKCNYICIIIWPHVNAEFCRSDVE